MTRLDFLALCERAAENLNIEIIDTYNEADSKDSVVEDDGILHVTRCGVRVAFDVSNNQQVNRAAQNAMTRKVLRVLDIPVTENALV